MVKIGDRICQFAGSDVVAILRQSTVDVNKLAIVGRALMFQGWQRKIEIESGASLGQWVATIGQNKPIRPQFPKADDYYSLFLDVETLQRLTR